ncbi:MAG: hypothetical protein ACO1RX_14410 [Candidatus Sericytochromatia bacterium]
MKHPLGLLVLMLSALSPVMAEAQSPPLPSLCRSGEFPYLTARLAGVVRPKGGGYQLLPKQGKIVSLCTDKAKEPFQKLVYRFGSVGNVELEQVATPQHRFSVYTRSTTPRTGENIFFFTRSGYTYYVVEATGMGSGVSLMAFHKGKRILDMFSGNEPGVDFEGGLLDLNFTTPRSPVLQRKAPSDKW